jgi:hypothetical protein
MDDLVGSLEAIGKGRNFEQGKAMFAVALCSRCHRFGAGQGPTIGPDLSAVISRFGRKDLLESVLLPSKVIDDKYRNVVIERRRRLGTDRHQRARSETGRGDWPIRNRIAAAIACITDAAGTARHAKQRGSS